ncbi:MAG: sulfotransferase domain-containing protein [Casimicrobiaceae bacterium]
MAGIGRNEPCPCGSTLRYKACHGRVGAPPRKVDFVVAGTQKGGTSALASYLDEHLDVCMPSTKEVHHFDKDERFESGTPDHTIYHAYFAPAATQRVIGDATPNYMYWEPTPARIADYNPAMKFIMMLRNPAKRAYSHWNMESKLRRETRTFEDAIRGKDATQLHRRWSYVDRGRYSRQLRRVWEHFPREQTLVLRSDGFQSDPAPALAQIATFLGIARFPRDTPRGVFVASYDRPMSDDAREFLHAAFAEEIADLETMLGWDLADWKTR